MDINLLEKSGVPKNLRDKVFNEPCSYLTIGYGDGLCLGLGESYLETMRSGVVLPNSTIKLWVFYFKWLIRKDGNLIGERFGHYDQEVLNNEFLGQKIVGFSKKKFLVEISFTNGLTLEIGGGRQALKMKEKDWFILFLSKGVYFNYNLKKGFLYSLEPLEKKEVVSD